MPARTNPFQEIYAICDSRNSRAKFANLPPFPRYIDIELTNRCNFRCLMCPVGTGSIRREKGFMSPEVFEKILREIAPHRTPVRFIRWGEPLLHPKAVAWARALKEAGSLVHINTNGSLLTEKIIDELLAIPLDSMKVSFQGVDRKSYLEMRNTDAFDTLLATLRLIHEKRGNRERPFLHVSTTITYETPEQVRRFRETLAGIVDLVTVGRTVLEHIEIEKTGLTAEEKEILRFLKGQESVVKKHPECPEVFDKLSVNWDGTVSACCGDYDNRMLVGDLRARTLAEIWQSPRLNAYREILADLRHDEIPLCRRCYDYFGLQTPGLQEIDPGEK